MKQADFEKEYHWLYGLDEYYSFTGQTESWEIMRKALMNSNYYRIRDVVLKLMEPEYGIPEYLVRRGCLNVLFRNEMEDVVIKPQMVSNLIDRYMKDDQFITAITRFINYWGGEGDGAESAVMPDLNDFLSRGQVKSKLWLVTELAKIIDGPVGNVVFYGGWYNFSAFFLYSQFDVDRIYSIDLDEDIVEPCKRLYPAELDANRFIPLTIDVNKLQWREKNELWFMDYDKREEQINTWMEKQEEKYAVEIENNEAEIRQGYTTKQKIREDLFKDKEKVFENYGWRLIDNMNMVVNTSCEHMDNAWFDKIPSGTFVVLQTNDYFENEQHSNCCKDLEDAKAKYPMQNIFYAGELDTQLYNRFMLIGIK